MSAEDDPRRAIDGILEGLAESVAHEDPDELVEEARSAGKSPKAVAERFKKVAAAALKTFEQRKLEAAREAYRARSSSELGKGKIAGTPEERRRQLSSIQRTNPEMLAALTTQYREFESSDEDIESMLEDLAELGFLDDSREA
jgi:AraC-like DNA-binding protein